MKCDVQCDTPGCDFLVKDCDPYQYHNVMCPKCNMCNLINDKEVALMKTVDKLQVWSDRFTKFVRFFGFKPKMATMSFDAAPMRHGKEVDIKIKEDKDNE